MSKPTGREHLPESPGNHEESFSSRSQGSSRNGPVHHLIVQRAHRKWKERGCKENTALQDWLEAEAEVKAEIRLGLQY